MRLLFALPGLHRYDRGAEVVFTSLAAELARGGDDVTLIGAGEARANTAYRFLHAGALRREQFEAMPKLPSLRGDTAYEEATFIPGLLRRYRPSDYDLTMTCSFPFVHWALRRPTLGHRPAHVFVTQNGDWPVVANNAEFRFFRCDGLVCINPDYYENGRSRWPSALIPNGVAIDRFAPGPSARMQLGLPDGVPIILMASALIASKRVADGVRAVAAMPGVHLVVAGDGAERDAVDALAAQLMPGRFRRITVGPADMPGLYRSADAFMHLSLDEPFGNVYIEAMACGLPIVGPDLPRTRWIVGDDQFLCNSTEREALVAALGQALLAKGSSRNERQRRAQLFSWPNVAAQYREFFADIIRNRPKRR